MANALECRAREPGLALREKTVERAELIATVSDAPDVLSSIIEQALKLTSPRGGHRRRHRAAHSGSCRAGGRRGSASARDGRRSSSVIAVGIIATLKQFDRMVEAVGHLGTRRPGRVGLLKEARLTALERAVFGCHIRCHVDNDLIQNGFRRVARRARCGSNHVLVISLLVILAEQIVRGAAARFDHLIQLCPMASAFVRDRVRGVHHDVELRPDLVARKQRGDSKRGGS